MQETLYIPLRSIRSTKEVTVGNGPGMPSYTVYVHRDNKKLVYTVNKEPSDKQVLAIVTYKVSPDQNFWRLTCIDISRKMRIHDEVGEDNELSLFLVRSAIREYATQKEIAREAKRRGDARTTSPSSNRI